MSNGLAIGDGNELITCNLIRGATPWSSHIGDRMLV